MLGDGIDRAAFERSLAARLIDARKLEPSAVDRAWRLRENGDAPLEALLIKLGLVSERDVAEALSALLDLPILSAAEYPGVPILDGKISKKFLRQAAVLPISIDADRLCLAMVDPLDEMTVRAMEMASGKIVDRRVALPSEMEAAHVRLYEEDRPVLDRVNETTPEAVDETLLEDVDRLRDLASEGPVIRLVSQLITRAIESRASDIHIEPFQNRVAVRYRIDGILREVAAPPPRLRAAIISRIKIMAKLNIAERRLPQDGRLRTAVQGRDFDLRVATVPTLHGECVVMRILDRSSLVHDLPSLGFGPEMLPPFSALLDQPQGILLVTGPTGSGKTTTLYTSLMRLNSPEKKLFTVEDPIEYQLEGVNQIQVKPQIGLSFAHVLRAILRLDPDIIMIGEMRDLETAEIAIQAALTGHLVLSTLHTNSAASTITRLLDMGVAEYLVASTVNGVLAQRLVRRLCEHCRTPYRVLPELARQLRLGEDREKAIHFFKARGCEHCQGTGYRGRVAVLELLQMSDNLRRFILQRAAAHEIHRAAVGEGMRAMHDDGIVKALAGLTSFEEVIRVTREV